MFSRVASSPAASCPQAPERGGPPPAVGKILVVDDDTSMQRVLETLLSRKGYVVTTASDGPEALVELERDTYDLMLSDIRMEPMDGFALLKRSVARYKGMPVILLSAYYNSGTVGEVKELGAFAFVAKPFRTSDLMSVVREALASRADRG
jgi:DNA-binding NtrC family response regulator